MTERTLPLSREEVERLADYNSEVARGIVHTEEYDARMALLQRAFDREHASMECVFAALNARAEK